MRFCGRLFETNSDIKTMFSKLKMYETVAELRSSKILEDHAMKVICTIDDAIVNLDDMEYVTRMLQTVAQSHSNRFPNFDPEFFSVNDFFVNFCFHGYVILPFSAVSNHRLDSNRVRTPQITC